VRKYTYTAYKERFLVLKTTINHYSANAEHYYSLYQSISASSVHGYLEQALANITPSTALDVGAGSGRDANWLAAKGWQVTATEPAEPITVHVVSTSTTSKLMALACRLFEATTTAMKTLPFTIALKLFVVLTG